MEIVDKKYKVTKAQVSEVYDESELNNLIHNKVTAAFQHMLRNIKVNEELYHYETKYTIKRIK